MLRYPNLEAERARQDIRKCEFAERLGVTVQTYRNWQVGRTEIPRATAKAMCDILGCSEDYLLNETEARECQG